ncbi:alcohol dehydrogenase catalytic domain-containing protein [Actinoplanes sp. NPDC048796]|uniref:alcohol dehydrogenase catalytic domain-containing protein n=1 Tax=unclassified Actinoplanes TaxID=2626549 RepID=UPI0033FFA676
MRSVVERDVPMPGAGEIRVRMHVVGVIPADAGSGRTTGVPGQDGAGVVDAVGPDVPGPAVGDLVWVWGAQGTAQEYVVLPRRHVVPLPPGVSFDVGASLGVPALTAHRALTMAGDEPRRLVPGALTGRVVLVPGAAGAVENAAIQLASWAGAHVVVTVASPAEAELARAAGADHVRLPEPDGGGGLSEPPDIVVDVAAAGSMTEEQRDEAVASVSAAVAAHRLRAGAGAGLPVTRFPLAEAAAAVETAAGQAAGRVLIDI